MKTKVVSVLGFVLIVFALVVGIVTMRLRARIRAQMLDQKGSILHAVTHFEAARDDRDPLDTVLGLVDLDGVLGIRFYSHAWEPIAALPARLVTRAPVPQDLERLHGGDATAHFEPHVLLDTLFADPFGELTAEPVPLLRVLVNLEGEDAGGRHGGYVEFLVDGAPMSTAFRELDRALLGQSLMALGVGGGLILAVLMLSLLRLERANRELAEANRELTLHLKTAAVGSVSAHLFHRLNHAVSNFEEEGGAGELRAMVQEVLDLFQDQDLGLDYELNGQEILSLAAEPLTALADDRGVTLRLEADAEMEITSRRGNLLILAVQNVLRNAIEVTPRGRNVTCGCSGAGPGIRIRISDQGPGIGDDQLRYLFKAGYTSKPGGNGIGLSISRQLCRLAGGDLRMVATGEEGTTFEATLTEGNGTS